MVVFQDGYSITSYLNKADIYAYIFLTYAILCLGGAVWGISANLGTSSCATSSGGACTPLIPSGYKIIK